MSETLLRIAADHPALEGHFPGRPIVPAAVLLAEVMAAVEGATSRAPGSWILVNAKFLRAVEPDCDLALAHESLAGGRVRFEIRSGDDIVSSGELAPA